MQEKERERECVCERERETETETETDTEERERKRDIRLIIYCTPVVTGNTDGDSISVNVAISTWSDA